MTIYIEYFLLQNILINFCLLKLIHITTKNKTNLFKLILASIIGASFSVFSATILTNNIALNFFKLTCAVTMIYLAFNQTFKQFAYNFILLFIYTFAFNGAINSLSSSVYLTSFGAVMTSKFSLEAITISCIVLTYIFEQVLKHIRFNIKLNKLIYKVSLTMNNTKITINAFLDTGNLLKHNNEPVVIIDFNSYLKLSHNNLALFFNEKNEVITNTVNGKNNLKIFNVEEMEIFKENKNIKLENQTIAVTTKKFNDKKYQALLSPLFF